MRGVKKQSSLDTYIFSSIHRAKGLAVACYLCTVIGRTSFEDAS